MGSVNLWSYRNAGSLSAPLRGSTAAAAWPRIGSASTERPWRSCVSPQSASCSENSAIRPGAVAGLVGIECGVVSGVINLESSGVEASDWRPRHDEHYYEA